MEKTTVLWSFVASATINANSLLPPPQPAIDALLDPYPKIKLTWAQRHPKLTRWGKRAGKLFFYATEVTGDVFCFVRVR